MGKKKQGKMNSTRDFFFKEITIKIKQTNLPDKSWGDERLC